MECLLLISVSLWSSSVYGFSFFAIGKLSELLCVRMKEKRARERHTNRNTDGLCAAQALSGEYTATKVLH